jgi:hypothetical protein
MLVCYQPFIFTEVSQAAFQTVWIHGSSESSSGEAAGVNKESRGRSMWVEMAGEIEDDPVEQERVEMLEAADGEGELFMVVRPMTGVTTGRQMVGTPPLDVACCCLLFSF